MADALIALHFQNDICHPEGRIPFSLNRTSDEAESFFEASRNALDRARADGWTIVHVHISFAEDYSDLPRNCRLFRAVEELGAVKRGSWGAAPLSAFEPLEGEIVVTHGCNSAFRRTNLEALLDERLIERLHLMGLATQFSVEHTVRDAVDIGYRVTVLSGACASADAEAHRASLRTLAMLAEII
jgi:nicotinamidase-related amidase